MCLSLVNPKDRKVAHVGFSPILEEHRTVFSVARPFAGSLAAQFFRVSGRATTRKLISMHISISFPQYSRCSCWLSDTKRTKFSEAFWWYLRPGAGRLRLRLMEGSDESVRGWMRQLGVAAPSHPFSGRLRSRSIGAIIILTFQVTPHTRQRYQTWKSEQVEQGTMIGGPINSLQEACCLQRLSSSSKQVRIWGDTKVLEEMIEALNIPEHTGYPVILKS